jgi:hypothetical protein
MRAILAVLSVAAVLAALTPALAEKRLFIIANNPDGYGVDRCLASGAACGTAAATAYCASRVPHGAVVPQDRPRRHHGRDPDRRRLRLPWLPLRRVRRHRVRTVVQGVARELGCEVMAGRLGRNRVAPGQSRKAGEIPIGRAERQAVLDCQRGEVRVRHQVAVATYWYRAAKLLVEPLAAGAAGSMFRD